MRFKLPIRLMGKLTMAFLQANHGTYSNPGTQVGTHNENFSALSQTDLTRVQFPLWRRLCWNLWVSLQTGSLPGFGADRIQLALGLTRGQYSQLPL